MEKAKMKILVAILAFIMLIATIGFAHIRKVLESDSEIKEVNEENEIVVGFCQPGAESDWRVAHTDSVLAKLNEENGYKLYYVDGKSGQDNQIKAIRTFVQQKVDYIVLSPIVESGWDSVLEEAASANIPVIICDREVDVADKGLYTAYVGSNFNQEGRYAVAWLKEYLQKNGRDSEEINIVHIQGTIDSSAQKGRSLALIEAVEENNNWNMVAQECGDFTKPKAYEKMKQILENVNDIDVVYCENDNEAFGVIDALDEAGISYGQNKGVIIISFDATRGALEKCMQGKINLVVECNPVQGDAINKIIKSIEAGEDIPKRTYIEETYFTPDTLSEDFIESRPY